MNNLHIHIWKKFVNSDEHLAYYGEHFPRLLKEKWLYCRCGLFVKSKGVVKDLLRMFL